MLLFFHVTERTAREQVRAAVSAARRRGDGPEATAAAGGAHQQGER